MGPGLDDHALCADLGADAAGLPAAARRLAGGRDGGGNARRQRAKAAAHRRGRRHAGRRSCRLDQRSHWFRGNHRPAYRPAHSRSELPHHRARLDDRWRGVPGSRRHRGQNRAAGHRGPDRGHHSGHRRAVLPLRAPFPARQCGPVMNGGFGGSPGPPAQIAATAVGVSFGAKAALEGVSVSVARGEWVALIGPNGAGKTTLLRAIGRMIRSSGGIELAGHQISRLGQRKLARLIAYVPQHPVLPPEMTGLDYLTLGRTPHLGYFAVESDADRRICLDLLDRMTLGDMADRRLATMSGGEAQRLVLARALAQQAPILLLDEPTSALDLGRRVDALELIDELRDRKSTRLNSSHLGISYV